MKRPKKTTPAAGLTSDEHSEAFDRGAAHAIAENDLDSAIRILKSAARAFGKLGRTEDQARCVRALDALIEVSFAPREG